MNLILRLFLICLTLLFSISIINAYEYNASHTNLTLENNGWCQGIEVQFQIWNKTDYDNEDEIRNDICEGEKNEQDNNCFEFHWPESGDVLIFDGPFDSLPELYSGEANESGAFSYTFENFGSYLIEVRQEGEYNDYHEIFEVDECTNSNLAATKSPSLYNVTLNYPEENVVLTLINSDVENEAAFTVTSISDPVAQGLPEIEEFNKIINLKSGKTNFDVLSVDIEYTKSNTDNEIEMLRYNEIIERWSKFESFTVEGDIITINPANPIAYVIVEIEEEEEVPEIIIEAPEVVQEILEIDEDLNSGNANEDSQDLDSSQEEDDATLLNEEDATITEISGKMWMWAIIVVILLGVMIGASFMFKKNPKQEHDKTEAPIDSYTQTYNKTKEYVKQYKENYSKDQLYRALEQGKVPYDVIDKVFSEEF